MLHILKQDFQRKFAFEKRSLSEADPWCDM